MDHSPLAVPGLTPPSARRVPRRLEKHGHVRVDDYYWLRERGSAEVTAYLEAENAYADAALQPLENFRNRLFAEMKARVKQDDSTVPFRYGEYFYYAAYRAGREYPVFARKKGGPDAPEEVLLDVNELARGRAFCQVLFPSIRPDHGMIAYAVDTSGRRFYDIHFKDLATGEVLAETIKATAGDMEWANDGRTLFYVMQDPVTLRADRVLARELGGKAGREVFREADETFDVSLSKPCTDRYVFIRSGAALSTEYLLLDASAPSDPPRMFQPRRPGLEYEVTDGGAVFYVLHNDKALNFRVSVCPPTDTGVAAWTELVPHREDTMVEYIEAFEDWLVLKERSEAQGRLRVIERATGRDRYIDFDEQAYMADLGDNCEYRTDTLRLTYESMTTPGSVYDIGLRDGSRKLMKRREVLGGFKPGDYVSERLWFAARDGEKVPVTLVRRKDLEKGGAPLHICAYGSYGDSSDPYFSSIRLSLLDRGFVCAVPHVRGGSELGRRWYDEGRLLKKKNTFFDFIDATRCLVERGYAAPGHIYAEGASAGGLLVCAAANMAPELYKGILAEVPFVDIVTTMLDPDLPLTTGEYDEWGDPGKKEYYDYMLSYSPYDNVERKAYPSMLITAGLNDSQVQYWEPAKWAAKLRALKTDDNLLLLKTDMDTGHGGKSGRFEAMKLVALEYAFLLGLEGVRQ